MYLLDTWKGTRFPWSPISVPMGYICVDSTCRGKRGFYCAWAWITRNSSAAASFLKKKYVFFLSLSSPELTTFYMNIYSQFWKPLPFCAWKKPVTKHQSLCQGTFSHFRHLHFTPQRQSHDSPNDWLCAGTETKGYILHTYSLYNLYFYPFDPTTCNFRLTVCQ